MEIIDDMVMQMLMGIQVKGVYGPWNPTRISGNELWLKANNIPLEDGADVDTWPEYNGYDCSVVTAASPVLRKSQVDLNGRTAIQFSNGQALRNTSFVSSATGTIFCVWKITTDNGHDQYAFDGGDSSHRNLLWWYRFGSTLRANAPASIFIGYSKSAPFSYIITRVEINGSSSAIYENGVSKVTGTLSDSMSGITVGGKHDLDADKFLSGYIAEIIRYDHVLSSTNVDQVEQYLSGYYGIALAV